MTTVFDLRGTNPGVAFPARLTGRAFTFSHDIDSTVNPVAATNIYKLASFPAGTLITHAAIIPTTAQGATCTVDLKIGASVIDTGVNINSTTAVYTISDTVIITTAASDLTITAGHTTDAAKFTVKVSGYIFD
jgi:hypothetical protein